jgi:hypothetical protein
MEMEMEVDSKSLQNQLKTKSGGRPRHSYWKIGNVRRRILMIHFPTETFISPAVHSVQESCQEKGPGQLQCML